MRFLFLGPKPDTILTEHVQEVIDLFGLIKLRFTKHLTYFVFVLQFTTNNDEKGASMLKKLTESIVQTFIQELQQDKIFVESVTNKKYTIKGFKFNDNDLSVLKQTEFKLYITSNNDSLVETYAIRFDLFKHKNIASVAELYKLAKEKLNEPNYKDKIIKAREQMIKKVNSVTVPTWNPAWGVAVMQRH